MTDTELPAWIAAREARPGDVVEFPYGRVRGEIVSVARGSGRDGDGRPRNMVVLTVKVPGDEVEHHREGRQFVDSQLRLLARDD